MADIPKWRTFNKETNIAHRIETDNISTAWYLKAYTVNTQEFQTKMIKSTIPNKKGSIQ